MATNDDGTAAPSAELQFDKAEVGAKTALACKHCRMAVGETYFVAAKNDILCNACAQATRKAGGRSDFLRAFGYGAGAAFAGTLVWLLVIKVLKMEIGLIAIGVGLLVGLAVRKGARGHGGRRYQVLAIVLTYVSITSSYVPLVLQGIAQKSNVATDEKQTNEVIDKEAPGPDKHTRASAGDVVLAMAFVLAIAFAAPFLAGASNIMGIFIIAIALYEAWKVTRAVRLDGPFRVGTATGMPNATAPPAGEVQAPR